MGRSRVIYFYRKKTTFGQDIEIAISLLDLQFHTSSSVRSGPSCC